MRVLFDNGTPRGIAKALLGHTVQEARSQGWDTLRNGELLDAAEAAGFEVFLTPSVSGRPIFPQPRWSPTMRTSPRL